MKEIVVIITFRLSYERTQCKQEVLPVNDGLLEML